MRARHHSISVKTHIRKQGFELVVELCIPTTGVTAILGASGTGKTTLLRVLAGLEKHGDTKVSFKGVDWQWHETFVAPSKRELAFVFQDARVFEFVSVAKNLSRARDMRIQSESGGLNDDELIAILGISPLLNKSASSLSGGEKQRVAIACAILRNPKLLLMDEPLSSLDDTRKHEILPLLVQIKNKLKIPIVYVTHSLTEAAKLADQVIVLSGGEVVSQGAVKQVFADVSSPLYQSDLAGVLLQAKVVAKEPKWGLARAAIDGHEIWLKDDNFSLGESIRLRILSKDVSITLAPSTETSILNCIPGEVVNTVSLDETSSLISVSMGSEVIVAKLSNKSAVELDLVVDKKVWLQIKAVAVI